MGTTLKLALRFLVGLVRETLIAGPPPPPGGVSFLGGFQLKSPEEEGPSRGQN